MVRHPLSDARSKTMHLRWRWRSYSSAVRWSVASVRMDMGWLEWETQIRRCMMYIMRRLDCSRREHILLHSRNNTDKMRNQTSNDSRRPHSSRLGADMTNPTTFFPFVSLLMIRGRYACLSSSFWKRWVIKQRKRIPSTKHQFHSCSITLCFVLKGYVMVYQSTRKEKLDGSSSQPSIKFDDLIHSKVRYRKEHCIARCL